MLAGMRLTLALGLAACLFIVFYTVQAENKTNYKSESQMDSEQTYDRNNILNDLFGDSSSIINCVPEHLHLAYGDTTADIVILWATKQDCSTDLLYGINPWYINTKASGSKIHFTETNPYGLQYLHRVYLKNLEPKTTYFYRPISNSISSGPFYFKTQPRDSDWSPLFMVYGDLGVHTQTIPYITNEVLTGRYTAILHVGDFAYNLHDEGGQLGDRFMEMIEGFSSKVPYITAPGNHEIDDDTFAQYRYRFSMPNTNWPIPLDKMWYSIDVGCVHLISYSTEVFFTLNQNYVKKQRDWLIKDLMRANENREKQPWIVALGHRPMYCSNVVKDDCSLPNSKIREGFEDIFYHYGVDIVLQAHEHSYERLYPMYKNVVLAENYINPLAPVQFITGAAGSKHGVDPIHGPPYEVWSAFRKANQSLQSYGKLQVLNHTHAKWEQKSVIDSKVIDSIFIVQENHGPFHRDKLPENISAEIEESIQKTGLKPVSLDDTNQNSEIVEKDRRQRIYVGVGFGSLFAVIIIGAVIFRTCRKKRRASRRWETMDFNYGKKFYSARSNDKDLDIDNDFEIDMSDGTLPTTKLLADD